MMGACGDDDCVCPSCVEFEPSPLVGSWECFYAEMNGVPYDPAIGATMTFNADGTGSGSAISGSDSGFEWVATNDLLILSVDTGTDTLMLPLNYTVVADTFTMFTDDSFMNPMSILYKFLRQ